MVIQMPKKVAIMGGTFNPVHNGHIQMAKYVIEKAYADEVWFMPNGNPPHKKDNEIVDKTHRANMVKLAIEGYDSFRFCDAEVKREGYSYLVDTLKDLCDEYDHEFYFMLGADSLSQIEGWYKFEDYAKYCAFLAFGRLDGGDIYQMAEYLKKKYSFEILPLDMPYVDIASTQIRECLKNGYLAVDFLPEKVYNYILNNRLYI